MPTFVHYHSVRYVKKFTIFFLNFEFLISALTAISTSTGRQSFQLGI